MVNLLLDLGSEIKTISLDLFKIMIPVLLVVKALELMGATTYLAALIEPLMLALGLPAEMGIVWAGTLLSNIYTGMVLFVSEPAASTLSVLQVTVLGILMLIAHSLPVELRVAQKIGVPVWISFSVRMLAAYGAAWLYFWLHQLMVPVAQPATLLWNPVIEQQSLSHWAMSQLKLLLQIVAIITVLVIVLRVIRALKLDRLIHLLLLPILPLLGLTTKAVNVALVGMTLGLTYGGGLLIQESRQGQLSARELFFSVCLLLLCHGLIEDTLLIMLLGADLYGILLYRVVISLLLIGMMVFVLRHKGERFFSRRLLNGNYHSGQS